MSEVGKLNEILRGGFPKKSLNIFMGAINVGKCVCSFININVRNKKTGKVKKIPIGDFYKMIKDNQ